MTAPAPFALFAPVLPALYAAAAPAAAAPAPFAPAPFAARINFARADQVAGFGIGVTGVCEFIRAGEVDPREQRVGTPARATGGDER